MPEQRNTHLDKVCDICGDVGWEEAASTCCQCNIRRHGYCMRVFMPRVLKDWVCEECSSDNNVDSLKSGRKEDVSDTSRKVYFDLRRQVASRGQRAVETGKVKFLPTEEVIKLPSGSTKNEFYFMSSLRSKTEPAKFYASPPKRIFTGSKTAGPCMNSIRVRPNPSFPLLGSVKPPGFEGALRSSSISQHVVQKPKESKEEKVPQPLAKKCSRNEEPLSSVMSAKDVKTVNADAKPMNIMKETLSTSATSMPCLPIINAVKKESASVVSPKESVLKNQIFDVIIPDKELTILHRNSEEALKSSRSSPSRFHTTIAGSGQNFHDAFKPKNSNVAERETWNNQLKVSLYRQHVPAQYVIWTGGFKFLDTASATPGVFYGGFLAKPPCLVDRRAYEFSAKMPSLLQVNLVYQCDLQTDLFQNGCLDLCDIALYIFPADYIERSQQNYSRLSQLMEVNQSVMRTDTDGVELLIFTSKQLHVDSRDLFLRSNTDFFCGVFRRARDKQMVVHRKLTSLVSPLKHKHDGNVDTDSCEPVDMDIDMVGGQLVGIPDIVVSKVLNGDLVVTQIKEEIDCQGILQIAYGVSSPQPERTIKDSGLRGSKKNFQVLVDDLVNDPSIACPPPPCLSAKGAKLGSVIKAEGADNEKPVETRVKKGLQVSAFFSKDKSHLTATAVYGPFPVEVKAEEHQVVNNPFAACPPHLLDKGTKIELEVQDIEKPIETREKKGLQVSSSLGNDESKRVTGSFNAPCAGEIKAEMKAVKNDIANASHGLNASLPSNMATSVCSGPLASTRVKLSVAGRARENNGAASAGGLLRDESGKWIVGYNLNLGLCSSLATDLWALFQGIKLTWDRGYRKVVVESDSVAAVESLKKPLSLLDSNRALIESCRNLLNCKWDCKVSTITREENCCANWLATNVEGAQLGLSIIKVPPLKLIPLLENDCKRLPHTHDSQTSISKSP